MGISYYDADDPYTIIKDEKGNVVQWNCITILGPALRLGSRRAPKFINNVRKIFRSLPSGSQE